jgi:hypothetical protein
MLKTKKTEVFSEYFSAKLMTNGPISTFFGGIRRQSQLVNDFTS